MVKVTLEKLECDVCRAEAERYTIAFPDGMKILDRCERHAKKILALRDESGDWQPITPNRRGRLQVLTPQEINAIRQ